VIRVSLKDLLGRKLRLALTSLAVVMGVAMVSGTFVLTDTINAGFRAIFAVAYANANAVVTGKAVFGGTQDAPSFPASTLTRIEALPGVAAAAGGVEDSAQFVGSNGKVVEHGAAPGLAFSVDPSGDQRFNPLKLVSGHWPANSGQVAMDASTASSQHLVVGDSVGVIANGGAERRYRVSGIVDYGNSTSLGGATLAIFALATAQQLFHKQGELDEIDVAAKPGVTDAVLLAQIRGVLPPHTQVLTSEQQTQASVNNFGSFLNFIRYFLLAFGGIALFVGAFVIANTLSITIAQRAREFATLRTMGATSRQVLWVVILEGFVTGLFAATIGLFVGFALAKGLDEAFKAFGATLPQTGLVFATRTVVVSLVVGTLVTLAASLLPALRATRVPPIAAVREGSVLPPSRFARFGPLVAAIVCLAALALVSVGTFASGIASGPRLLLFGVGVLGLFLGVAMVAPSIARPLASVLGWPGARVGGVAGRLARANAMRNPGRTASTAAALMIGLALVSAVAVLAQGLKLSVVGSVHQEFRGDYVLTSENGFTPTSVSSAAALRKAHVASVVAGVRAGDGRAFGQTIQVTGLDPGVSQLLVLVWKQGSNAALGSLGANGAIIDNSFAKSHHLAVGSPIGLETPAGHTATFKVNAIFAPPEAEDPLGTVSISSAAFDGLYANPQNVYTLISTPGGVTAANTSRLNQVMAAFPNAKIQTQAQFISSQEAGIDSFLTLLYVLLALSIIVSLFGIVNTLVLTVFERTRELGMLRAVGMTRRQTRRMIRQESVVTALLGAALGIPLGILLAALFGHVLKGVPFAVPWGTIVIFVIAAIIVGLLAAIFPARRASRLNVLNALQYE
jgi:putative ABC transport system permease protein